MLAALHSGHSQATQNPIRKHQPSHATSLPTEASALVSKQVFTLSATIDPLLLNQQGYTTSTPTSNCDCYRTSGTMYVKITLLA